MSKIFMIGALDSLGVPYTIDNTESKSFVELIAEKLINQGISLKYINLCSLGRNKTWELINILDSEYTVRKYITFNQKASRYVIGGLRKTEEWNFPTNPNFVEKYYQIPEFADETIKTLFMESEQPIFLYSCGGMNIRQYMKVKTEMDLKVVRDIAKEALLHFRKHIIQTKRDIEQCLQYITQLNPNVQIYVLSAYAMLDNQILRNIVSPLVSLYNYHLKNILSKYPNMHYVDITKVKDMVAEKDMHPSYQGQVYIANQIYERLSRVMSLDSKADSKNDSQLKLSLTEPTHNLQQ